mmetsp:Transcript_16091/g.46938  ORF Transcript_16091/g.46938 Transcript_16091/m.46938 type:complete len:576 (+) Transcript_16091:46-1773(+)
MYGLPPRAEAPSVGPQFMYSRQQLMGYKGYRSDTRIGNWQEDEFRADMELEDFQRRRAGGQLLLSKLHAKMVAACTRVGIAPKHDDGCLRFGDTVVLQNVLTGTCVAANTDKQLVMLQQSYQVSGTVIADPCGRNAFTILKPAGRNASPGEQVTYGEPVVLVLKSYQGHDKLLLQTQTMALPNLTRSAHSKKDEVSAVPEESSYCLWRFIHSDANQQLPAEGTPVPVHAPVGLQHVKSNLLLSTDFAKLKNIFGVESDVFANLSRDTKLTDLALPKNYLDRFVPEGSRWVVHTAESLGADVEAAAAEPPAEGGGESEAADAAAGGDGTRGSDGASTAGMLTKVTFGPDGAIPGYVGGPSGAPGVIVVQEWWGVTPQVIRHAERIARAGYRVLVPDLYRGALGADVEEAHHLMGNLDFPAAVEEICHAATFLKVEGCTRVGVVGWCMGGALALAGASHCDDIACVAPFYGVNFQLLTAEGLAKPTQAHFGWEDTMVGLSDPESAKQLAEALADADNDDGVVHLYERVGHGFMNEDPAPFESFEERRAKMGMPPYDAEQAELAWSRLFDFLGAHLRG